MKKIIAIVFVCCAFLIPQLASAHVLQSDGQIGAIMHIDPNDAPVAQQPATFYFDIKDKTNKFDPKDCQCRVDIYENNSLIDSDALYKSTSQNSIAAPVFAYTFPKEDVYQVKLIGTPNSPGQFQPFTITYDVRVDQTAGSSQSSSQSNFFTEHFSHIVIILIGLGILGILVIKRIVNDKKPARR